MLLKQSGKAVTASLESMPDETPRLRLTPETYLGSRRMQYYYPEKTIPNGTKNFVASTQVPLHSFTLDGMWTVSDESLTSNDKSTLLSTFFADKVFLVLRPEQNNSNATIRVSLDGRPIDEILSGSDVTDSTLKLDDDRLYNIIDLRGNSGKHELKLEFLTPGISAFAFTFG